MKTDRDKGSAATATRSWPLEQQLWTNRVDVNPELSALGCVGDR
jgi:hypothetical protein